MHAHCRGRILHQRYTAATSSPQKGKKEKQKKRLEKKNNKKTQMRVL